MKATGESSESSTSLSIVKSVQNIVSVNLSLLLFFDFVLFLFKMWSAMSFICTQLLVVVSYVL